MGLSEKIKSKKARVGIIGFGYVGLPLGIEANKAGFDVTGFELSKDKIAGINKGESYIVDISSEEIKKAVKTGRFSATSDFNGLSEMDVIAICVPTPLNRNREPDVTFINSAASEIKKRLKKGQLVVLESTTYPGTTREEVLPVLEGNGLKAGKDFYLAFSPERVDPGNKKYQIKNTPKVIGGITEECTKMAAAFYSSFVDKVIPVSSPEAAEMTKLLENIFRCVNIALVNELMVLCDRMKINIWEVIEAAGTKPFGFMPFFPGPGLGGHCIPVDPFYLAWKAKEFDFRTDFIELAGKTNTAVPYFVAERTFRALNEHKKPVKGSKILVLGVAYKKDVADARETPAEKVIELLAEAGADISIHDPYVPEFKAGGKTYRSIKKLDKKALKDSDCVLILTDHSNIDYKMVAGESRLVLDTRNTLHSHVLKNVGMKNIIVI